MRFLRGESVPGDVCHLHVRMTPVRVFHFLALMDLVLIFLSIVGQEFKYLAGMDHLQGFVPLFDLDGESNAPTYYSGLLLLSCALLLGVIGTIKQRAGDRFTHHWQFLAIIFVYLSCDEVAFIHEYTIDPICRHVGATGAFRYAWILIAIPILAFLGFAYSHFLFCLPRRFLVLFVLSGSIYVGGAVGMEMVGGWYDCLYGQGNLAYAFITTVEESMEMLGLTVFVYTLLSYLRGCSERVDVELDLRG